MCEVFANGRLVDRGNDSQCIGADKPIESMECTGAVAEDKAVWITSGWTTVSECTHHFQFVLTFGLFQHIGPCQILHALSICFISKHTKDFRVQTLALVDNGIN